MAATAPINVPAQSAAKERPWLLRFGAANLLPLDDSQGLAGENGLGLIDGHDGIDFEEAFGVTFSLSYAFTGHWAVTLMGTAPFQLDIQGQGAIKDLPDIGTKDIGEAYLIPPALALEYRFRPHSAIRPYIGVGGHLSFWLDSGDTEPKLNQVLAGALGDEAIESTRINLDNSAGFAANVGVDWNIAENWAINANIWWLDMQTKARIFANGQQVARPSIGVDPLLFSIGLAWQF